MKLRGPPGKRKTKRSGAWFSLGKWLVFLAVVLVVLYPRLDMLPRTLHRYLNPNTLINPDSPALAPLIAEFDRQRDLNWGGSALTDEVEHFTYSKVPYRHDWNVWANVDYFPTVEETLEKGVEDCDGRAVVAASLLEHYGVDAKLANDFTHVWVVTEHGSAMQTAGGNTAVVEGKDEGGINIAWGRAIKQTASASSWMISAFPLYRELIIVLAAWLLLVGTRKSLQLAVPAGLVMLIGLLLIRDGETFRVWSTWVGWLCLFGAVIFLWQIPKTAKSR